MSTSSPSCSNRSAARSTRPAGNRSWRDAIAAATSSPTSVRPRASPAAPDRRPPVSVPTACPHPLQAQPDWDRPAKCSASCEGRPLDWAASMRSAGLRKRGRYSSISRRSRPVRYGKPAMARRIQKGIDPVAIHTGIADERLRQGFARHALDRISPKAVDGADHIHVRVRMLRMIDNKPIRIEFPSSMTRQSPAPPLPALRRPQGRPYTGPWPVSRKPSIPRRRPSPPRPPAGRAAGGRRHPDHRPRRHCRQLQDAASRA